VCWNSSVEVEGWRQWEICPCVRAGERSQDGLFRGLYSLKVERGKGWKGTRIRGAVVVLRHSAEHGHEPK